MIRFYNHENKLLLVIWIRIHRYIILYIQKLGSKYLSRNLICISLCTMFSRNSASKLQVKGLKLIYPSVASEDCLYFTSSEHTNGWK